MSVARRAPLRVVLATLVAACLAALTVAPAHAAAYRFWGFYQLEKGSWTFAQKGSDQTVPKDGGVDGWRFAVADEASTRYPRAVLGFDQICGSTAAEPGKKRVGVVVDFGRPADSADGATPPQPKAVCAVVATDATSTTVLAAAGEVRVEKGLVCGVAGYPAKECGAPVKEVSAAAKAADQPVIIATPAATPSASATPTTGDVNAGSSSTAADAGSNTAAYVIAVVVLLALIGYLVLRSRSRAHRDA